MYKNGTIFRLHYTSDKVEYRMWGNEEYDFTNNTYIYTNM